MPAPSIVTMTDPDQPSMISSQHFPEIQTGSLKRKRPPSLEIPNVLREISADVKEKNDVVSFSGSGVGVWSVKGKKRFMEDTHKIVSCSHGIKGFFGVYDGHGGTKAADFVAEKLHTNIFQMLGNCTGTVAKEEAVKDGYLKTDREFLKQGVSSGACCVTALIEGNDITVSNLGDCRAVLCRGGVAEVLTTDHRAGQEDEMKTIESKGGYVEMHRGAWRVHGVLSVSRSIGDGHLKEWVVADPDTKTLHLTPEMEFLVLASDGLWEKVGNQEAIDTVMSTCQIQKKPGAPSHDQCETDDKSSLSHANPASKLQRASFIKKKKKIGLSPSRRMMARRQESGDEFPSENESPPLKTRRISLQSLNQENCKKPASSVLVGACTELVNLAVSRGSLDDITVMIIDLSCFN